MKVAIISDTHFGARDGRHIFHDFFAKFYTNVFFPTLRENGVTTVLHLGDLFDRRKYIDYYSLKRSKEYFFEPMRDFTMHTLVGNHDIALRNSLEINSHELLLSEYTNIKPISDPAVIQVNSASFLMLPWICTDNYAKSMDMLKTAKADLCCGHLEISGFSMYKGMESHEGFDAGLFDRFDMVFSGHYHHRSSRSNIHYLGNPYEITHMDYNDQRGFHLFDTETRELTFVANPYTIFERFVYDDTLRDPSAINVDQFKEKFLKIVVQKKTDFYKFDTFLDRVYNCGAHDIKILEDLAEMTADELDDSIDIEDTQSILHHYIKSADVSVDREKLSSYMKQLYVEAVNIKV